MLTSALLIAALTSCKDGEVDDSTSGGGDDTADTQDTGEAVERVGGEDIVFHDGRRFVAHLTWDGAVELDPEPAQEELGGGSLWTAFGDFDGDGHDDLWQMPDGGDKTSVYMNDGAGVWDSEPAFTPDANVSKKRPVVVGDFDGDGKDDIGLFNTGGGKFIVYPLKVATFSLDDKIATETALGDVGEFSAADMNGDGWDDIVQLAGSDVRIYRVVDGALVDPASPWWEGRVQGAVTAIGVDMDGDGRAELATWSGSTLTVFGQGELGPDLEISEDFMLGTNGTPHAVQVR